MLATGAREIFRSDDLLVRAVPAADRSRWVVCFDHYDVDRALDRLCFGETFLRARGLSAIFVTCAGNDWYQYADIDAALAAILAETDGAALMTYGSSMGGYAAIRFAARLGADRVLALSPQYSIDRAKAPFERRWEREARRIRWREEIDGPIRAAARPVIVYDPTSEDRHHVALIARDIPIDAVRVPRGGHPVAPCLSDCHLLERLVLDMVAGGIDPQAFEREAIRRSRGSVMVLSELCRLQPPHRLRTAIALGRRAKAVAPESPLAISMLAQRLTQAGAHEEALALHAEAVARGRGFVGYRLPYAMALAAAGRFAEAWHLTDQLIEEHPDFAPLLRWKFNLMRRSGRKGAALLHWLRDRRARRGERSMTAILLQLWMKPRS